MMTLMILAVIVLACISVLVCGAYQLTIQNRPKKKAASVQPDNPNQAGLRELANHLSPGKPWKAMEFSGVCILLQSCVGDVASSTHELVEAAKGGDREAMKPHLEAARKAVEQVTRRLREVENVMERK